METAAALIPLLALLAVPAFGVWRLIRGLLARDWKRPAWFAHATWVFLVLTAGVWFYGLLSTGLDVEETCTVRHHQPYDDAFREAHRAKWFRLFPLSSKCNAGYELVPSWVNPAVAVFGLLFVVSLAGLGWTTAGRWGRGSAETSTKTSMEKGTRSS